MPILLVEVAAAVLAVLVLSSMVDTWRRKGRHLPPGPPGLPLLGNMLQIPAIKPFVALREFGNIYGDIVTLRVPGDILVVLNSRKAIADLLDARSQIYSDRPQTVMCRELVGWDGSIILDNNTPRFRTCRKLLHKGLGPSAVQSFIPFLNRQSAFYLDDLQKRPNTFTEIFKRNAAAISMKIAYGYDGIQDDEELYQVAAQANHYFTEAASVGIWLVDMLPILKHIPTWFPFAYFKRYAAHAKPVVLESVNRPFDEIKRHMEQGTVDGSFASMLLEDAKGDAEIEDCIKWASTGIFLGQTETTTAALSWFFLAMAHHPEVQAKAQAEIDKVVGGDRLPYFEDKKSLPYVSAVMQEVFRWHPVVPMIAHALSTDDEYRGYFIPAKTTLVGNIWAVMHDESVYSDADSFRPERFTEDGAPDCLSAAFGFGRRICPGMLIAQAHIFVSIATTLATFDIAKARDARGDVVEPAIEDTPGGFVFPQPFKVSVQPRSAAAADLIRRSAEHSRTLPERLEIFTLDA